MRLRAILVDFRIRTKRRRVKGVPANPKIIEEDLRKVRLEQGLLQKEVAKILGACEDTITGWKNNRLNPQQKYLPRILVLTQDNHGRKK